MLKKSLFFATIFVLFTSANLLADDFNYQLYDEILFDYVHDGSVDYRTMCQDSRLNEVIAALASFDPNKLPSRNAQIAFYINAYNAYTLKIICDNYPLRSINQLHSGGLGLGTILKKTVWDKPLVSIGGQTLTLNAIEHEILRKQFNEPRIHFALVCAAKSCPPLRAESYTSERLSQQLDEQAKIFLSQADKNRFDGVLRIAYISKIFSWFSDDFGGKKNLLHFISPYISEELGQLIDQYSDWKVRYTHYDWDLNE